MSRARSQWRESHRPRPRGADRLPARTREATAARNRAWAELSAVLGLPVRYITGAGGWSR